MKVLEMTGWNNDWCVVLSSLRGSALSLYVSQLTTFSDSVAQPCEPWHTGTLADENQPDCSLPAGPRREEGVAIRDLNPPPSGNNLGGRGRASQPVISLSLMPGLSLLQSSLVSLVITG